jgi:hypothetical protein
MSDYTQMWSDLGLDLKTHDLLTLMPERVCKEDKVQIKTRTETFAGRVHKK